MLEAASVNLAPEGVTASSFEKLLLLSEEMKWLQSERKDEADC